ncbi:sensor histidine kinase [Paenibacillus mendelii]|uniref:histidine kinase n=1 Tax=Paenibacillus mendelii TaxID=206163 RepID=A0ABV6J2E4_9BACL|nr:ATP-binding protein [Paenibacillus mendelii]MCQ6563307.1 HAMP domain-containing histidine kinase [Paenibacillus mendelii]
MNRFNHLPLRLRLTLLMALILTIASIVLMMASIYAARQIYNQDFPAFKVEASEYIPEIPLAPRPPRAIVVERNNDFTAVGIISAIMVIVIGTGLTYLITGRALKPVTDLSKEIKEIGENNLFRQVSVPPSNDEVSKLSRSFNRMIHKLEKAFVAHKNFSSNAAHELKTPLAAMIANIEVLQLDDRPTLDQYKETLEDTLHNAQRLSSLVIDLLKLNAEQNVVVCEKIEAKIMFDNIIDELLEPIQSRNIHIENRTDNVQLCGDKHLLHRAFSNIIHNAVKYNKPSGVIIIAAAETADNTRVTIFDTGIGIPEDQIDKIFDPFYCVDKSRSREFGGSGLGLAIVKMVIEKHDG